MASALGERLRAIVGADHLAAGESAAVDGVVPRFVARPANVAEVSRLLGLAQAEGLALAPRGAGTAQGLGNRPTRLDLVIELGRLNRVVEYEPADVTVSVEAGMTLDDLERVLGKHRQILPLDPPGWRTRTVGGVLATNASGPWRFRYGTGRDALLGVRFVQADGTVTWGGSRVVKSVTGYDIPKLLTGSLGTLGVIVETTLRLHPSPECERSWLLGFASLDRARGCLTALLDSPLQPSRVEIVNAGTLAALGEPVTAAALAVSIASVEGAVEVQGAELDRLARAAAGDARQLGDDFWERYGSLFAGARGVRLRLACLATSATELVALLEALAHRQRLGARVGGCAGLGALTAVLEGECAPEAWEPAILGPLRDRLEGEGGSVIVEQCPLALKERIDVWGPVDPQALALMRRIKTEFDPTGVLNPGRFVSRL
jgi:glycolate oxidase FAD binding subunit